jgi:hypothetical protein
MYNLFIKFSRKGFSEKHFFTITTTRQVWETFARRRRGSFIRLFFNLYGKFPVACDEEEIIIQQDTPLLAAGSFIMNYNRS